MVIPNGMWVWYLSKIRKDYINALKRANVKRVYLKVLDANSKDIFWDFQCTKRIIKRFNNAQIEVYGWGFHYGSSRFEDEYDAILKALDEGISGYIFDMETAVEKKSRHIYVESLLKKCRPLFKNKNMGYTSFGHPGFHKKVPWHILNSYCDFSMPQIYFEKFSFAPSNTEEVLACLKAHEEMGLDKPILPIWGSESDAVNPATKEELQSYLYSYTGSSIWRAPNRREAGEAWNLDYDKPKLFPDSNLEPDDITSLVTGEALPKLDRYLNLGTIGKDVLALEKALVAHQLYPGPVDGVFNDKTQAAVRKFQLLAGLSIDGIVGPETWSELSGEFEIKYIEDTTRNKLADIAQREADLYLRWTGKDSEAEKYLYPLRGIMQQLGHIDNKPIFYNWCAAFVTWCAREAGMQIPDQPHNYWASMALVQSWKHWAKAKGYWHETKSTNLLRGDIVVFEWFDGDSQLDHIGVVSSYSLRSQILRTSEGNRGNKTKNGIRNIKNVAGIIRVLD